MPAKLEEIIRINKAKSLPVNDFLLVFSRHLNEVVRAHIAITANK